MAFLLCESELFRTCRRLRADDPTLTIVNLAQRDIDNDGAMLLSDALQYSTHAVVLILTANMIRDRGAIRIAHALPPSVHYLYLGRNRIGSAGAAALSKLTHLQILDLHRNNIGCEGTAHLAKLLNMSAVCSLQSLVLRGNIVREEGMVCLARAMRDNISLHSLDLSENDCSLAACKEFKETFRVNHTLKTIKLGNDKRNIQEVLDLYHLGRAFLKESGTVKSIAWPAFFSKMAKEPDLLHYILRGRPDVFVTAGD